MAKKLLYKKGKLTDAQLKVRDLAMGDLRAFIALVAPERMLGSCHVELCNFLQRPTDKHQLCIWPRAHQKSTMVAYWCAWHIVNNPEITILLASATSGVVEKQLGFIKSILAGQVVATYWPELMAKPDGGKYTLWRNDEFCVEHWKRDDESIRDPTMKAVGVGSETTGLHFDVVVLDDIVVLSNADTKTERDKLDTYYSLLNSVLNPGGVIKAVGTRYHPDDLYNYLINMTEPIYDDQGEIVEQEHVYEITVKVVEENGQFLWPRTQRKDGKWFGFNKRELGRVKANYRDKAQFLAQYYQDPSDPENKRIENFQYYDSTKLQFLKGVWNYNGQPLNVFAAIDFAATLSKKSDYTAIVVIGIDGHGNYYVLAIKRFKTDKISVMFETLRTLYDKWKWVKLRAETSGQQNLVVEQIKSMNQENQVYYTIDKHTPSGDKQIRIMSNLEPRYEAGKVWHYVGGECEELEKQLSSTKPPHDDVADAFASAVEIALKPRRTKKKSDTNVIYHPKWGGVVG